MNELSAVEKFLGRDFSEKYKSIYPLLDLILYRISDGHYSELYMYDGMVYPLNGYKKDLRKKYTGYGKYVWSKILASNKKKNNFNRVLLSESIVKSNRLRGMNREIIKLCDAYAICRYADFRNSGKLTNLKKDYSILYFGSSVSGDRVKKDVSEVYKLFEILLDKKEGCGSNKDIVDKKLECLAKSVSKQKNKIKKILVKNKIDLFITYNQDRLADLLIIMACRELGIWTKELLHYWYPSARPFLREDVCYEDFKYILKMYANESCQWNGLEKEYMNIRSRYKEDVLVTDVGCPEITEKDIEYVIKNRKNNEVMNIIVFWPTEEDIANDNFFKEAKISQIEYKYLLINQINELAIKNNVNIYIRIHPSQKLEEEIEVLIAKSNITIDDNLNNSIRDAIMNADIAIGGVTSALYISKKYGLDCYCFINNPYTDKFMKINDIHLISISNISKIKTVEPREKVPEGNIDLLKLLSLN